MLTYWCPASCRFCYVCAGPGHTVWAKPSQVVNWWQALGRLAEREGTQTKIHVTGGEPFGRTEVLFEVLERAREAGLPAVENVETNAFWATDDAVVRENLTRLKSLGVTLIATDADIFHQEFVPLANVQRMVRIGREVLGPQGVRVRWWDFYERYAETGLDVAKLAADELADLRAAALRSRRERLTGRAAELAGQLFRGQAPAAFAGLNCRKEILRSRHVHIDPYGNVFPGVCCGLVLGNAVNEDVDSIYDWLNEHGPSGPVFTALVSEGPCGLIMMAHRYGFVPLPGGYVSKCQLCYHLRRTLYRANQCRKWLGPKECYSSEQAGRDQRCGGSTPEV